jgi:uncharacterized membrane protein YtjA (UPF0391 family)
MLLFSVGGNGLRRSRATAASTAGRCQEGKMLYWALVFLVIAIIAGILGFWGLAATAAVIAKIIFFIFLVIFVVSLLVSLAGGGWRRGPPVV